MLYMFFSLKLPDLTTFLKRWSKSFGFKLLYVFVYWKFISSLKSDDKNYRNMHVFLLINFNFY